MTIPASDLEFLKQHPDEMEWFHGSVNPSLFANLKAIVEELVEGSCKPDDS